MGHAIIHVGMVHLARDNEKEGGGFMRIIYRDLLRHYAKQAQTLGMAPARIALISRSVLLRDVIAFLATHNTYTSKQLRVALADDDPALEGVLDPKWLAAFGEVVALQQLEPGDTQLGLKCLQLARRRSSQFRQTRVHKELEAALLFEAGRYDEVQALVGANKVLQQQFYNYLGSDARNPFVTGSFDEFEQWLHGLNRPFTAHGLSPVSLTSGDNRPFDRLVAQPSNEPIFADPKVSVIMTSYKPEPNAFLLAAHSILRQSWQNLELIIVDDATPGDFPEILANIQKSDERVTVIQQPVNAGTYQARNAGLAAATGDYITGQDSDDWSHPDRIHHQVQYLADNPQLNCVMVQAIRVDENLVRTKRGQNPLRRCEVSFMVPARVARSVGGYLPARKAADTEFRWRVEQAVGPTGLLREPLYLTRLAPDSLSRGDFGPGWVHPVRRAFRSAFALWHQHTPSKQLVLQEPTGSCAHSPVPIPNKFRITAEQPQHYDVVFASDWRGYSASQRAMLDEIHVMLQAGKTVGVLHMESLRTHIRGLWHLNDQVQQLINDGTIGQVIPDDKSVIDVLVFHDPTILQFLPTVGIDLAVNKVLIFPELPHSRRDGEEAFYHPTMCDTHTRAVFDAPVTWAAIDPAIRTALTAYQDDIVLSKKPLAPTFDAHRWKNHRTKLDGAMPVVGRHSDRIAALWPAEPTEADQLWPVNGAVDIRILGDDQSKLVKYHQKGHAPGWVVFDDGGIQPEAFMRSLDFFVYFPDRQWPQQYCRQALEAQSAGCLVILPEHFRTMHGEGPLYAQTQDVASLIQHLAKHQQQFHEHLSRAQLRNNTILHAASDSDTTSTMILAMLDHRPQEATS